MIVRDHVRRFTSSPRSLCVLSVSALNCSFSFVFLNLQLSTLDFQPIDSSNSTSPSANFTKPSSRTASRPAMPPTWPSSANSSSPPTNSRTNSHLTMIMNSGQKWTWNLSLSPIPLQLTSARSDPQLAPRSPARARKPLPPTAKIVQVAQRDAVAVLPRPKRAL